MTKQMPCPKCGGFGHIQKSETWDCGNGTCGGRIWSEKCQNCHGTGIVQIPMTNADHIRAMTDEEMLDFIDEHSIESPCEIICGGECRAIKTFDKTSRQICREIILNWLKQPYGGADHE